MTTCCCQPNAISSLVVYMYDAIWHVGVARIFARVHSIVAWNADDLFLFFILFLVVILLTLWNTPYTLWIKCRTLLHPITNVTPALRQACTLALGGGLTTYPHKFSPSQFYFSLGGAPAPTAPLATPVLWQLLLMWLILYVYLPPLLVKMYF